MQKWQQCCMSYIWLAAIKSVELISWSCVCWQTELCLRFFRELPSETSRDSLTASIRSQNMWHQSQIFSSWTSIITQERCGDAQWWTFLTSLFFTSWTANQISSRSVNKWPGCSETVLPQRTVCIGSHKRCSWNLIVRCLCQDAKSWAFPNLWQK